MSGPSLSMPAEQNSSGLSQTVGLTPGDKADAHKTALLPSGEQGQLLHEAYVKQLPPGQKASAVDFAEFVAANKAVNADGALTNGAGTDDRKNLIASAGSE